MRIEKGRFASEYLENFRKSSFCFPELEKYLSVVSFKKGEFVYEHFQISDKLYFLQKGIVKLSLVQSDGHETLADYYQAPAVLGEMELLKVRADSHPIQAVTECVFVQLTLSESKELIENNPKFLMGLCQETARKNATLTRKIIALQTMTLEQRLAAWFLAYKNQEGNLMLPMTLTETANYFGVTYRHLSRVLNRFKVDKAIENSRGKIRITDSDYFRRLQGNMTLE